MSTLFAVGLMMFASRAFAADHYWSGGSPDYDNINDSRNWFDGVPASGDNLYFNHTTGFRHYVNNQNASDYFGYFITYSGANGIRLTGGLTYLYKFENNSDPNLLEATATLSNRTGPDSNIEINPVGSGGVKVANVDIQNGKQLLVYGNNQLEVAGSISQSGSGNASLVLNGAATVLLESANTYAGATTLNAGTINASATNSLGSTSGITVNSTGTLLLTGSGVTDRIKNSSNMNLAAGATLRINAGLREGTSPSGPSGSGGSAGIGALTLAGTSGLPVTIDFGGQGSTLAFSSLDVTSKGSYVNILNWTGLAGTDTGSATNDRLLFASDPGFTQTDLAHFNFSGFGGGATEISYGGMYEIVPVPEPSTWGAGFLAVGAIGLSQRGRFLKLVGFA